MTDIWINSEEQLPELEVPVWLKTGIKNTVGISVAFLKITEEFMYAPVWVHQIPNFLYGDDIQSSVVYRMISGTFWMPIAVNILPDITEFVDK